MAELKDVLTNVEQELLTVPADVAKFAPPKHRNANTFTSILEELRVLEDRHRAERMEVIARLKAIIG